jgi:hypothetical protein
MLISINNNKYYYLSGFRFQVSGFRFQVSGFKE